MISLKNRSKGFTIVELLIVIVVIGILATLVIVTFTGVQKKARDSQRQTDINAVEAHLQTYYAEQDGKYPTVANLTDSAWVTANLKGLDAEALKDPKGGAIQSGASDATHYGYAPVNSGGTACTNAATDECVNFTLTATLEGGGIYTKKSNN